MLLANNIQVNRVNLTEVNTSQNYMMVEFDLTWENSWQTSSLPKNWDAAWVFVKFRVGTGEWQHAWLNGDGHIAGTSATIEPGLLYFGSGFNATTNPAMGVFIYRSANGTGNFSVTGAKLRWNYGNNNVADDVDVEVKVFAIEMVYIPHGAFYIGSGGSEDDAFYRYPATNSAFNVLGEDDINVGTSSDYLYYSSDYSGGDQTGPIPAVFPKGARGFYCMKYEISQQEYVDFLNTLTSTQAANRYSGSNTGYRYGITATGGVFSTTNPYVACNFLSWMDGVAYSDWAGLRPITELEYENACRGTSAAVANEYAWGAASVAGSPYSLNNNGQNTEAVAGNYSITDGNASYNTTDGSTDGPLRVGIFAANTGSTGMVTAGASFWGIMELNGNLSEHVVTVGNASGRTYTGMHGNGILSANGYANVTAWPGLDGDEVTGADGSGFRGGDWNSNSSKLRVSDRNSAAFTSTERANNFGFRAVRSRKFSVGEEYGGGIIFYLDGTGEHGLVAATSNQSTSADWGCDGTYISGTGTALGTGKANTTVIVNGCNTAGIAARICDDLVLNGYDDWFLPSKDELNLLYQKRSIVGGFTDGWYWSSSETSSLKAWLVHFPSGNTKEDSKFLQYGVRAVRTF